MLSRFERLFLALVLLSMLSACLAVKIPETSSADTAKVKKVIGDVLAEPSILSSNTEHQKKLQQDTNQINFISTISGGGYRAGGFALGHLIALDSIRLNQSKSLFDELDFVSSVSGGGIAVGAVMSAALNYRRCADSSLPLAYILSNPNYFNFEDMRSSWAAKFVKYSINPLILKKSINKTDLFYLDYYNGFLSLRDCQTYKPVRPFTLKDIENAPSLGLPLHISNATISTSGHILPFTSSVLETLGVRCFASKDGDFAYVNESEKIPYSIGIAASAAFPPLWPDIRVARPKVSTATDCSDISYYHLTDGGQSDDNGYVTGLNLLSELGSIVDSESHALIVSVDALGDREGLFVDQASASNIFNTYLMRNHNLPRYSLKREFRKDIIESKEKARSLINSSIGNSQSLALHVNMSESIQPGADISTFANALGISKTTLIKVVLEGMLQTYKSFIVGSESTQGSLLLEDVRQKSHNLLFQVMCGDQRIDVDGECHAIIGRSDLPKLTTKMNLDQAWNALLHSVNELGNSSVEKPLLEVALRKKNIDWSEGLQSIEGLRRKYLATTAGLSRDEIEKSEDVFETQQRLLSQKIADNYRKDAEQLLSNTFTVFNEAGIDRSVSVVNSLEESIENNALRATFTNFEAEYIEFNSQIEKLLEIYEGADEIEKRLLNQNAALNTQYQEYIEKYQSHLAKEKQISSDLYSTFKSAAQNHLAWLACEVTYFSEANMSVATHTKLMSRLNKKCDINVGVNVYGDRRLSLKNAENAENYTGVLNDRLLNFKKVLLDVSNICGSSQLVVKNTLDSVQGDDQQKSEQFMEKMASLTSQANRLLSVDCSALQIQEFEDNKSRLYSFSGDSFDEIDLEHQLFTENTKVLTDEYNVGSEIIKFKYDTSVAKALEIREEYSSKANIHIDRESTNLQSYYKDPALFRTTETIDSTVAGIEYIQENSQKVFCNEFSQILLLRGDITNDQVSDENELCASDSENSSLRFNDFMANCDSLEYNHVAINQCEYVRFTKCFDDIIQKLPDLENRKSYTFKNTFGNYDQVSAAPSIGATGYCS